MSGSRSSSVRARALVVSGVGEATIGHTSVCAVHLGIVFAMKEGRKGVAPYDSERSSSNRLHRAAAGPPRWAALRIDAGPGGAPSRGPSRGGGRQRRLTGHGRGSAAQGVIGCHGPNHRLRYFPLYSRHESGGAPPGVRMRLLSLAPRWACREPRRARSGLRKRGQSTDSNVRGNEPAWERAGRTLLKVTALTKNVARAQ
jgi:hypothetical protein